MRSLRHAGVLVLIALISCTQQPGALPGAPAAPAPIVGLQTGWNRIEGGPDSRCSGDQSFAFYARQGDPRRLMVYFQGGGGCWNSVNCDLRGRPTFDPWVDSTDSPANAGGLLDLANLSNPVREFSIVFVPYCTGDVHLGASTLTYFTTTQREAARSYTIHHAGAANVARALEWVYANVARPELIFVAGSDAGAVASPVYAAQLARHYRQARVVQLGDAAGGFRANAIPGILARWGAMDVLRRDPAYAALDSAGMNFEAFYIVAARQAPRATFAQFNTAEDGTQLALLEQLGVRGIPLPVLLARNLSDVRNANLAFRSYTAPGSLHTILLRPAFYLLAVDGVRIRDWVAALIEGRPVQDVGSSLLAR
jgi:hypothetical protein